MTEKTKNLCAQIPESLHNKVREKQMQADMKLDAYMTWLITKFYELEGKGMEGATRTLAVQIPAELFDRLERYLESIDKKKKPFMVELLDLLIYN